MRATTYFGYRCPKCGTTVDIGVAIGGGPACPTCGTPMEPDQRGTASAANVYCQTCKTAYGLVNSDRCPKCGGPFTKLP